MNDGRLNFTADDGVHGRCLWSFDGSAASLVDTEAFVSTAQELIAFDGSLCFRGVRVGDVGVELNRVLPRSPGISNGGFEGGTLSPWSPSGAAAIVPGGAFDPPIAPAEGQSMGYVTTLNNEGAMDFGYFDESPDIDGDGVRETEYSSLSITFSAATECVISFDLNFLTAEFLPGSAAETGDADVFGLTAGAVGSAPNLLLFATAPPDGS